MLVAQHGPAHPEDAHGAASVCSLAWEMIESVLTVSSICRVLYFIGSVFVGEVLNLVMRLRKADKVSTGLGSIAAIGLWSVLPLADSIPQEMIGPKRLRIMLVIAIIIKAYYLGWCKVLCILVHASVHACMHACMHVCKVNAAQCHAFYDNFSWDYQVTTDQWMAHEPRARA